jgi:hypothetical protein
MTDFTAQYTAGDAFTRFTGYLTHGPGTSFGPAWATIVYFDTQTNALAAWTSKSGTTKIHDPDGQNISFKRCSQNGVEVFFRWDSDA